jgi:beta-galactosidase
VELGAVLGRLAELAREPDGPVNRPQVAIAWDPDAWWAAETRGLPSDSFSFYTSVRRVHRALWYLGVNCDFVRLDHDLSGYAVVLVPSQLLASAEQSSSLHRFVDAGGHAAVWYFGGTFDQELHIIPGGYSGAFAELLGVRVEELMPLERDAAVGLDNGSRAADWSERIELRGATSIANYASGAVSGSPAITVNSVGEGRAYYVSTELDDEGMVAFLTDILDRAEVVPDAPGAGNGLEAIRRFAGGDSYLFVINHDDHERETRVAGTDVLTGSVFDGPVVLQPGEILVLRESRVAA